MQDELEAIWEYICTHDDSDFSECALLVHITLGILGIILLLIFTPIGCIFGSWFFLTLLLSLILFAIWANAPEGKLSVGYFFAMHFFSMAWVVLLPIALVIGLLCLPIIISKCV